MAKLEENIDQKYQSQMTQILDENEELKKIKLENDQHTQIIASLRSDNIELKDHLDSIRREKQALADQLQNSQNQTENNHEEKVSELNASIAELNEENRKLAGTLAEVTSKSIELEKKLEVQSAKKGQSAEMGRLTQKLAETTQDYNELVDAYNALQDSRPKSDSNKADIAKLQEQNQSLRETIRAQNEALLATDDSVKLFNKLKTENENLRLQLTQMKNMGRGENERVAKLENQITLMNNALQAKDQQIQQLSQENRQLAQAKTNNSGGYQSDKQASLRVRELEQEIEKSKQVTIEYRKKIKEYQDELMAIQSGQNNNRTANTDAFEEQVRILKLQNQELKARIKLLSGNADRILDKRSNLDSSPTENMRGTTSVISEDTPSVTELLEQDIDNANVQYIRENYEHLKPMATASENNGLNDGEFVDMTDSANSLNTDINSAAGHTDETESGSSVVEPSEPNRKNSGDKNIVPEIKNKNDPKSYDENYFNS